MTVRVTADHFPGNNGIKEVAVNYNSLSKPFLKIFKWEIDGVNPVVISQLNVTFWFSLYQIYDTLRYSINEYFITFCLFNKLFPVMPKLLIDSPSAFKLGLFSEDNITSSENAKNVRKWLNALNFFRFAIGQFGFEIYSMSSCCLCFVFTCFDLLLSLLFHAQSHGKTPSLEKKNLNLPFAHPP